MIPLITLIGKFIHFVSYLFNIGSGGTWPGEIVLQLKPDIFSFFVSQLNKGLIIVAGTNGKTTTAKMIRQIIGKRVILNQSGANLLNGLVSAFIEKASLTGKIDADFAVLEVDENTLPQVLSTACIKNIKNKKLIVVLLNLFRDQLDRYGEVDIIANKWKKVLERLPSDSTVILNADDPQIAYLGKDLKSKVVYFGIDRPERFLPKIEHATDSTYCHICGGKLTYKGIYFSHLGIWFCENCGNSRPKPDVENYSSALVGLYNEYNTLAAVSVGRELGIKEKMIKTSLASFTPAFGRQEEFEIGNKKIKMFLSKNPAGFNASLRTVLDLKPKSLLLVLNDRIPDGRDVSWIWDTDFEMIPKAVSTIVSGDRVYDMGLRIKYTLNKSQIFPRLRPGQANLKSQNHGSKLKIYESLKEAIDAGLNEISEGETLYILSTYSAMLEVRKILTGRKIL
jgi:UDP-N-acetylmuramyl tripeptide synthase